MVIRPRVDELALFFKVPLEQIMAWKKEGMPLNSYYEAAKWFFHREPITLDKDKLLKQELLELMLKRKQGKLLEKDIVLSVFEELMAIIKEEYLGMSGRLAALVANKDIANSRSIIDSFAKQRLNDLSTRVAPIVEKLESTNSKVHECFRMGL